MASVMQRWIAIILLALGLLAGVVAWLLGAPGASGLPYRVVEGWPTLARHQRLGQATGIGLNSRHELIVFHRADRTWTDPFPTDPIKCNTIVVFDAATGRLLSTWGAGRFIMPHGLTVDTRDNIWVTDVGLHQVFKFSRDGRLLLTVGEPRIAGADSRHFNQPTDVAVLPDGSFYVSDGYINTRVAKFSAEGHFLFQWGGPGTGSGQFDTPHGIALDGAGRVYVADRGNARIQIFDPRGRFIAEWKRRDLGRPYGIAISGALAAVVDGGDQPRFPPNRSAAIILNLQGKIAARFGSHGAGPGQFQLAHDVAIDGEGMIYVAEAWGERVQKFVPDGRAAR